MTGPNLAKRARLATGLTQRAFAELIGTFQANVGRWETGKVTPSGPALSLLRLVPALPLEAIRVLPATREAQGVRLDKLEEALARAGRNADDVRALEPGKRLRVLSNPRPKRGPAESKTAKKAKKKRPKAKARPRPPGKKKDKRKKG